MRHPQLTCHTRWRRALQILTPPRHAMPTSLRRSTGFRTVIHGVIPDLGTGSRATIGYTQHRLERLHLVELLLLSACRVKLSLPNPWHYFTWAPMGVVRLWVFRLVR